MNLEPNHIVMLHSQERSSCCNIQHINNLLRMSYGKVINEFGYIDDDNLDELEDISCKVHKSIEMSTRSTIHGSVRFLSRIILIGPRGSGCRIQAKYLSEKFNLMFGEYRNYSFFSSGT